jgi:hypothetical protein
MVCLLARILQDTFGGGASRPALSEQAAWLPVLQYLCSLPARLLHPSIIDAEGGRNARQVADGKALKLLLGLKITPIHVSICTAYKVCHPYKMCLLSCRA